VIFMIVGNICVIALRTLIHFDSFKTNGLMEGVDIFVCREPDLFVFFQRVLFLMNEREGRAVDSVYWSDPG
jgi:hypothetical protein